MAMTAIVSRSATRNGYMELRASVSVSPIEIVSTWSEERWIEDGVEWNELVYDGSVLEHNS
jgi:hypothetical protein